MQKEETGSPLPLQKDFRWRALRCAIPGGYKAIHLKLLDDFIDVAKGVFVRDVIVRDDFLRDLVWTDTPFQPFPDHHRRFVQLVVFLCVEVDEYTFNAVEVSEHHVLAGNWIRANHTSFT